MRDYRKKFKLTPFETLSDLYELGVLDDTAYIQMQNAEEKRLNALKGKKKSKEVTVWEHSDDQFFLLRDIPAMVQLMVLHGKKWG